MILVCSGKIPAMQGRHRRGVLTPALFLTGGSTSPGNFAFFFLKCLLKICNPCVYKIKWPKTEEKQNFGVGNFQVMTPTSPLDDPNPPLENLWRRHCLAPWAVRARHRPETGQDGRFYPPGQPSNGQGPTRAGSNQVKDRPGDSHGRVCHSRPGHDQPW